MKKDVATKLLEEYPDVFADIGNVNLYDGKPIISPDELELLPSTLFFSDTNGERRELRSDIRMRHKKNGIDISVICLENQSGICNTMPVRDMGYEYASYEEQIRKIKAENRQNGLNYFTKEIGDHQKLTPVIPIILYFGREQWSAPLSLFDILSLTMPSRTRFLIINFANAFVSFNRRSHHYDSFNCLRIRKIDDLKSSTVCGVFWRTTRLEDEVLLAQDEDEKRSGSPKYAIHGGFDLTPSG